VIHILDVALATLQRHIATLAACSLPKMTLLYSIQSVVELAVSGIIWHTVSSIKDTVPISSYQILKTAKLVIFCKQNVTLVRPTSSSLRIANRSFR